MYHNNIKKNLEKIEIRSLVQSVCIFSEFLLRKRFEIINGQQRNARTKQLYLANKQVDFQFFFWFVIFGTKEEKKFKLQIREKGEEIKMQRKLFNYVHSLKPGERLEKLLCGFLVVGVRY